VALNSHLADGILANSPLLRAPDGIELVEDQVKRLSKPISAHHPLAENFIQLGQLR
jgi:hypothetical protein